MRNINQIMQILNCTEDRAFEVFKEMSGSGFDFSGCTNAEFKQEALLANEEC